MNQHKNINNYSNKRYFYNEARSQQSCRAEDLSGAARVANKNSRNLISRVFFAARREERVVHLWVVQNAVVVVALL